ncbi:unnamed protein product, partial [Amoebophrya sp. A120]
ELLHQWGKSREANYSKTSSTTNSPEFLKLKKALQRFLQEELGGGKVFVKSDHWRGSEFVWAPFSSSGVSSAGPPARASDLLSLPLLQTVALDLGTENGADADIRHKLLFDAKTPHQNSANVLDALSYKSVVDPTGCRPASSAESCAGQNQEDEDAQLPGVEPQLSGDEAEEEHHVQNLWSLDNRRLFVFKRAAQMLREAVAGLPGAAFPTSVRRALADEIDLYVPVRVQIYGLGHVRNLEMQKQKFSTRSVGKDIILVMREWCSKTGALLRKQEQVFAGAFLSPYLSRKDEQLRRRTPASYDTS